MKIFTRISVIGLGYIGLPTAAVFADRGIEVIGVDVSDRAVEAVNRGEPHITEPNLGALLRRVVETGKLRARREIEPADAFIIAVPTPFQAIDGHHWPDLSFVEQAARSVARVLKADDLVILESTSPPGTTERMCAWMAEERPDLTFPTAKDVMSDIRVAHCPERVLPGRILDEVVNNARVVGGISQKCTQYAVQLYKIICEGECRPTNARTAELVKLAENAYRDVNIAYANELSVICDKLRTNVWELIKLANLHPRVNILRPGPGVGGHCIAVDPWFIVDIAQAEARLIQTAREVNDAKPEFVIGKVRAKAHHLVHPVIACLGLSYKSDIADLRESPAVHIVAELARGQIGEILVVEPHIDKLPDELEGAGVTLTTFDAALDRANLIVLLVDHMSFLHVDRDLLKDKFVIDTVGTW
jgi:UDP-N-acetyl-D-mannosaminuronic acid dehydrogenase